MKKIFIGITALLFIMSSCAESKYKIKSEYENDAVEFFEEIANENDYTLLLDYRTTGKEVEEYNDFIDASRYYNEEYTSNVIYKMYDEDVEEVLNIIISTYDKDSYQDFFYATTCIVEDTSIEYYHRGDNDLDYYELEEDFEEFCDDIYGEIHYEDYE